MSFTLKLITEMGRFTFWHAWKCIKNNEMLFNLRNWIAPFWYPTMYIYMIDTMVFSLCVVRFHVIQPIVFAPCRNLAQWSIFPYNGVSAIETYISILHLAVQQDVGCRFRSARPLFSLFDLWIFLRKRNLQSGQSRFQPQKFIHRAAEVLLFESRPRWRRGEAKRGGGKEEGRMGHWESDMYMYVLYTYAKKSGPFPRSSDNSYALPPCARLFNFNRLPIFLRSIPPRGDLKGHGGSAWLYYVLLS